MKDGIVGLAVQTPTISRIVIFFCAGTPMLVQTPPDDPSPVVEHDRPSCCENISHASHQLYFWPGRCAFCPPRIVWLSAPKNCPSFTAQATGNQEWRVQLWMNVRSALPGSAITSSPASPACVTEGTTGVVPDGSAQKSPAPGRSPAPA